MPYKENNVDLWAGRSFEFRKRVNLILTTRLNTRNFIERPFVSSDSNSFFFDRTLLLGNITIIKRNFLKTRRINGFGKTEDIPVGGSVGVLFGKEYSEFVDRPYLELDGTLRKYITNFGYLSVSLAAGSYFKNKAAENGLVKISSLYFSDLVKVRKLQLRQFLYFNYVRGLNRILDRTVSLEGKWRSELNGERPFGDEKMTVGVETVYFMPWYTYGFQFALYHRFDINLLATEGTLLSRSAIFPVVRVGMRTLNENLVLPTLSIEVGYYGHNRNYDSRWEVKLSTTLPNLFGTFQAFKPQITSFE
jgi:hypothetical protein